MGEEAKGAQYSPASGQSRRGRRPGGPPWTPAPPPSPAVAIWGAGVSGENLKLGSVRGDWSPLVLKGNQWWHD
jgi:hypothetical protein